MSSAEPTTESVPEGFVRLTVIDRTYTLATALVPYGAMIAIAYVVYMCVRELAGKETLASFLLNYMSDAKGGASAKPWIAATVGASAWALAERWLRHRTVAGMSRRITNLEWMLGPQRASRGWSMTAQSPKEGAE